MSEQPTSAAASADALVSADASSAQWLERYAAALLPTYGTPQRVLVRGEGAYVWDADGRRYLDLLGGIATNALGHAHPTLVGAVTAQLSTLGHVSNFFASAPQVALAERLLGLLEAPRGSRVFFANSGAEANEGAFKIARRTGRPRILALEGAFHGRTLGALALTHKAAYREPFEPLPGGVEHLPFGDLAALEAALDDQVAALVLEPVQGEAGVRPLPEGYLVEARRLTERVGALLVVDEVQTGMGRTGAWFAHTRHGVVPDVVTLAKGLGGGIPVGAVVTLGERASGLLTAGQHGTTFGGNPVAAAAALATIHVIERDGLLPRVQQVGRRIAAGAVAAGAPLVAGVRGEGLLLGVHLHEPRAAQVASAALEAGFIVNAVAPDTVRLAPPLILTPEQADSFLAALPAIVAAACTDDPPADDPQEP
ncbi:acetylornithine transaminase [Angustibacter sp. Root456]|uniref:acetylornithine transaminase n=1 Tax=Angustibacter sp. Root456 TaxID=1736539 RepID=UPI00070055EB|nr:acetylornithine transaminase [Angustibacter sp. Root456]KQX63570.1 acetylornithine aminotransferase [Angustibacter sp. Root456]